MDHLKSERQPDKSIKEDEWCSVFAARAGRTLQRIARVFARTPKSIGLQVSLSTKSCSPAEFVGDAEGVSQRPFRGVRLLHCLSKGAEPVADTAEPEDLAHLQLRPPITSAGIASGHRRRLVYPGSL
jgi:hypothetical protein